MGSIVGVAVEHIVKYKNCTRIRLYSDKKLIFVPRNAFPLVNSNIYFTGTQAADKLVRIGNFSMQKSNDVDSTIFAINFCTRWYEKHGIYATSYMKT